MRLLFTAANVRNVICLSPLVVQFELEKEDYNSMSPNDEKSNAAAATVASDGEEKTKQDLTRKGECSFTFTERVPMCCCCSKDVKLQVSQRWDFGSGELLYESISDSGIHVRKRRVVSAGSSSNSCVVSEWIEGRCSACLSGLVEGLARDAHVVHMDKYHLLLNLRSK
jgi:hypothetical protein